jgi:TubC N-terminal docking domain
VTAEGLLQTLRTRGAEIAVDRGALRLRAPKGMLTAEVSAGLREHRADLLVLLRAGVTDWATAYVSVIIAAIHAAGAEVALEGNAVTITGEERLPPALRAEVARRERGLLLYLTHEASGDQALAALLRAEEVAQDPFTAIGACWTSARRPARGARRVTSRRSCDGKGEAL